MDNSTFVHLISDYFNLIVLGQKQKSTLAWKKKTEIKLGKVNHGKKGRKKIHFELKMKLEMF